jgi:histone deacetylase HOS3
MSEQGICSILATKKRRLCPLSAPRRHVAVFIQDACLQHQYIRSKDLSSIVERPERLRAVKIGIAAAIARLESILAKHEHDDTETKKHDEDPDDLAATLDRMKLIHDSSKLRHSSSPVSIIQSRASVDILKHPAVKFIHGDIDGDIYLEDLTRWAKESWENIHQGGSEIPEGLPQGDLYRSWFLFFTIHNSRIRSVLQSAPNLSTRFKEPSGPSVKLSTQLSILRAT